MSGYVYIMSNRKDGVIYTGVTANPEQRIYDHRNGLVPGFTKKYGCKTLVWMELHPNIVLAIKREKAVKRFKRIWKVNLIERSNPDWCDLYDRMFDAAETFTPKAGSRLAELYAWSQDEGDPPIKLADDGKGGSAGDEERDKGRNA